MSTGSTPNTQPSTNPLTHHRMFSPGPDTIRIAVDVAKRARVSVRKTSGILRGVAVSSHNTVASTQTLGVNQRERRRLKLCTIPLDGERGVAVEARRGSPRGEASCAHVRRIAVINAAACSPKKNIEAVRRLRRPNDRFARDPR